MDELPEPSDLMLRAGVLALSVSGDQPRREVARRVYLLMRAAELQQAGTPVARPPVLATEHVVEANGPRVVASVFQRASTEVAVDPG